MPDRAWVTGRQGAEWGDPVRANLPVENAGSVPLCLFVEPYGEDFWLEPGEAVTVLLGQRRHRRPVRSDRCGRAGECVVFENGDPNRVVSESQVLDTSGTPLECGHQRYDRRIPGPFLRRGVRLDSAMETPPTAL